jgi:hypothetical protein
MKRAIVGILVLAVVGLMSLSFDTSCNPVPNEFCKGDAVNRKMSPGSTDPDDHCSECVEARCCDLLGDCQKTECAGEVATMHECVLRAERAAKREEPGCRTRNLKSAESDTLYACMRNNCGETCGLPTCLLDPRVPFADNTKCDGCFAQSCCSLMNECAGNRSCLLTLKCIIDECKGDFATELLEDKHVSAIVQRDSACDGGPLPFSGRLDGGFPEGGSADGGAAPPRGAFCFAECIGRHYVEGSEESRDAYCKIMQINECGTDVGCGKFCALDAADAAADGALDGGSDAPDDASGDAADDASDAGAD